MSIRSSVLLIALMRLSVGCSHASVPRLIAEYCTDKEGRLTHCDCQTPTSMVAPRYARPNRNGKQIELIVRGRWFRVSKHMNRSGQSGALAWLKCSDRILVGDVVYQDDERDSRTGKYLHRYLVLFPSSTDVRDNSMPICQMTFIWGGGGHTLRRTTESVYVLNRIIVADEATGGRPSRWYPPKGAIGNAQVLKWLEPPAPIPPPRYCPSVLPDVPE